MKTDKIKSYLILNNQRHQRSICRNIGTQITQMIMINAGKIKIIEPPLPHLNIFYYVLFVICSFLSLFPVFAQDQTDSLKGELQKELHDTTRINALLTLSTHYINTAPDTALIYAEQALQLANTVNWQQGIGNAQHSVGHAYYIQGNFAQCLHHWNKALEIRKQLADSPDKDIAMADRNRVSASLGNIGNVYRNQGDYSKALSYFFQALEMDSVMGNKNGIAANLGNIGIVYDNQGDYPKALSYFFRSLEMDSVTENKKEIAIKLGNIGSVYYNQGDYPKALSYYFRSLEMDSVMGFKSHIAANLGNIGIVYHEQGNYPKAISYYFQALEMDNVMGDKNGVAIDFGNIGALYTKIKQYDKAEQYLKRSLAISDSIGALFLTMSFEKSISELYAKTNRWQKAYNHHVLYSNAKDTVFGEEKTKAIGRVEMKHELEMAELERKQKEEVGRRQQQEAVKKRDLLQYSLIFFVIAIILIAVLYSKRLMAALPEKIFFIKVNKTKAGFFLIFIFIFILFETLLLFADPYITTYTNGAPAFILLINAFLAMLMFPLHSIIETTLAKKKGMALQPTNTLGMITGLILIVVFNSFTIDENPDTTQQFNNLTIQQSNIRTKADSLLNTLSKPGIHDTEKVNILNNLFLEYEFTDKEKVKEYLSGALHISEKLDYNKGLAQTYTNLGYFAEDTGNYAQALIHYERSLNISKESDDKKAIAATLGNIGIAYWNQSDYPKALSYHFQALEMDSVLGNKEGIVKHLGNIGLVFWSQGNYHKSLSYFFQALEMDSVLGNKKDIATDLGNIGNVYADQGDYPKALSYFFQSLEMDSVMGNKKGIAIRLGNIGSLYTKIKEYDKAEQYLKRSLAISDSIETLKYTMTFEKSISELYAQTNRWQLAYNHHILYSNAKDTVFGEEKTKAIGRVEMKHEIEMAEFERKQKEEVSRRQQQEAVKRRDLLQYSAIFIGFFVLLGVIMLLSRLLMPAWFIEFISFVPFLILFEFILVFTEPYLEVLTGGAPLYRLLFNGIFAGLLYPLQQFSEAKLKRLFYRKMRKKVMG